LAELHEMHVVGKYEVSILVYDILLWLKDLSSLYIRDTSNTGPECMMFSCYVRITSY